MLRFDKDEMSAHILIAATPVPELIVLNEESGKFSAVQLTQNDLAALEKQLQAVRELFRILDNSAPGWDSAEFAVALCDDMKKSTAELSYQGFAFASIEIRAEVNKNPCHKFADDAVRFADAIEASLPYWAAAFPDMDLNGIYYYITILGKKHIPV